MKILAEETSFLGQNLVTKVFAKKKKKKRKRKEGRTYSTNRKYSDP